LGGGAIGLPLSVQNAISFDPFGLVVNLNYSRDSDTIFSSYSFKFLSRLPSLNHIGVHLWRPSSLRLLIGLFLNAARCYVLMKMEMIRVQARPTYLNALNAFRRK